MAEVNQNENKVMDDLSSQFLTFYIDDAIYGIPLADVIEIINIQNITTIPNVPAYIKGITNLRGKVVPVLDVHLKMNKMETEYNDKTCIIVVDIHEMQIGLVVDSVSEVITLTKEQMAAPPKNDEYGYSQFLDSIVEMNGKIILNIDFDKFFKNDLSEI